MLRRTEKPKNIAAKIKPEFRKLCLSSTKTEENEAIQDRNKRLNTEAGKTTIRQLNRVFNDEDGNQSILTDDDSFKKVPVSQQKHSEDLFSSSDNDREESFQDASNNLQKESEDLFSSLEMEAKDKALDCVSPTVAKLSQQLDSLELVENSEQINLKIQPTQASTVSNRSDVDLSELLKQDSEVGNQIIQPAVQPLINRSPAASTVSNSNSYRLSELMKDEDDENIISLLDESSESFEKAQGGETPEKKLLEETIPNTPEISQLEESSVHSIVIIDETSDEEEEKMVTPTDSLFSAVVSDLQQSQPCSSNLTRFYNDVPSIDSHHADKYQPNTWMKKSPTKQERKQSEPKPKSSSSKTCPSPKPSTSQSSSSKPSKSSNSSSDQANIKVSINISLKINANVREAQTTSSDENSDDDSQGGRRPSTSSSEENTTETSTTSEKIQEGQQAESLNQPTNSGRIAKETKNKLNKRAAHGIKQEPVEEESKPGDDENLITEEELKVLNAIYGSSWQTPVVTEKLSTAAKQSLMKDKTLQSPNMTLDNTASFNLRDGLSSTRLNHPRRQRATKPRYLQMCDSDSESADSQDSWQINSDAESSESEKNVKTSSRHPRRKNIKPTRPRVSSFSGSSCGSDDGGCWTDQVTSPKRNVKSPTLVALPDGCELKQKKVPPTSTKRRLYTPNDHFEDEACLDHDVSKNLDEYISRIHDDTLTFHVPEFLLPKAPAINKNLEKVKESETPKQTPKTPKTLSPKINKKPNQKEKKTLGFLQSLDVNTSQDIAHPMALMYRKNYRTKKEELTSRLFEIYNEAIFDNALGGIKISWNKKLTNTAGRCCMTRKNGQRNARIELSDKVLSSADRLRCTLIHEMCHAATWIFDDEDGHGRTWKSYAHKANKVFPELPKINVCHQYEIEYKYTYQCKLCKASTQAHSKSKKVEKIQCRYCKGPIEILLNKKDKDGNKLLTPVRPVTGFAKYVAEQYKTVKQNSDLKHAQVMKVLSEKFGALSADEKSKYSKV